MCVRTHYHTLHTEAHAGPHGSPAPWHMGVHRGSKVRWARHTPGQLEAGGTDLGDGSGCGSFLQTEEERVSRYPL